MIDMLTALSKSVPGCNSVSWLPNWNGCCMVKHSNCTNGVYKHDKGGTNKGVKSAYNNNLPLKKPWSPTTMNPLITVITSTSNPTTTTDMTTVVPTTMKFSVKVS